MAKRPTRMCRTGSVGNVVGTSKGKGESSSLLWLCGITLSVGPPHANQGILTTHGNIQAKYTTIPGPTHNSLSGDSERGDGSWMTLAMAMRG